MKKNKFIKSKAVTRIGVYDVEKQEDYQWYEGFDSFYSWKANVKPGFRLSWTVDGGCLPEPIEINEDDYFVVDKSVFRKPNVQIYFKVDSESCITKNFNTYEDALEYGRKIAASANLDLNINTP